MSGDEEVIGSDHLAALHEVSTDLGMMAWPDSDYEIDEELGLPPG